MVYSSYLSHLRRLKELDNAYQQGVVKQHEQAGAEVDRLRRSQQDVRSYQEEAAQLGRSGQRRPLWYGYGKVPPLPTGFDLAAARADLETARDWHGVEWYDLGRKRLINHAFHRALRYGHLGDKLIRGLTDKGDAVTTRLRQQLDTEREQLSHDLDALVTAVNESVLPFCGPPGWLWSDGAWDDWEPPAKARTPIRLGMLWRPATRDHAVPALVNVPGVNLLIGQPERILARRARPLLLSTLTRAMAALPAGQLRLTFVDAASLGEVVSPILELASYNDQAIDTKVWTGQQEIATKVQELIDHSGRVIQKYLTGRFETIAEYNAVAGETAEPYRLLVVNGFPSGFTAESAQSLLDLLEVGPRCGISTILSMRDPAEVQTPLGLADNFWSSLGSKFALKVYAANRQGEAGTAVGAERLGNADYDNSWGWATKEPHGDWHVADYDHLGLILGDLRFYLDPDELPELSPVDSAGQRTRLGTVLDGVGRAFADGATVQVDRKRVFSLLGKAQHEGVQDGLPRSQPVDPEDEETWWTGEATTGLSAPFGRIAGSGVACLAFDSELLSSAVLVGRPGSGKSTLLHATITSLAMIYPPDELELYLLDFKEGVEFMGYATARLPHSRVVAIEAERDLGLSVLEAINRELEERGRLFRSTGGQNASIGGYRLATGETISRILLVVDEFHKLFDQDDRLADRASRLLDNLVRQGRGFGIHCLLASQTLAALGPLGRHTLGQIPIRMALQCSEADSRVALGEDNPDAQHLTRAGEGILNPAGGVRAHNSRFQATFVEEDERMALLDRVRRLADKRSDERSPRVFQRNVLARVEAIWPELHSLSALSVGEVRLPLGTPMTLDTVQCWQARREAGANLLVIGKHEEVAAGVLSSVVLHSLCATRGDAAVRVVDLMAVDGLVDRFTGAVKATGDLVLHRRRTLVGLLDDLVGEVARRQETDDMRAPPILLLVNGLGRARDLDMEDLDGMEAAGKLERVLRDGAEVGVHTVLWCDTPTNLDRRLSRTAQRELRCRVVLSMSAADSLRLTDTEEATGLREHEALYFDEDRGHLLKFQPFAVPDLEWAQSVLGGLDGSSGRTGGTPI